MLQAALWSREVFHFLFNETVLTNGAWPSQSVITVSGSLEALLINGSGGVGHIQSFRCLKDMSWMGMLGRIDLSTGEHRLNLFETYAQAVSSDAK